MALRKAKPLTHLKAVLVVLKEDDAIDLEHEDCDYEEYQKTGDLNKLVFVEGKEPTRFVCNFNFNAKQAASVKNSMIAGKDDEGKPTISLGSWQYKIARMALKDIQNPSYLSDEECFKYKELHGYVDDKLLVELDSVGVVDQIFSMYSALVLDNAVRKEAKNSSEQ